MWFQYNTIHSIIPVQKWHLSNAFYTTELEPLFKLYRL